MRRLGQLLVVQVHNQRVVVEQHGLDIFDRCLVEAHDRSFSGGESVEGWERSRTVARWRLVRLSSVRARLLLALVSQLVRQRPAFAHSVIIVSVSSGCTAERQLETRSGVAACGVVGTKAALSERRLRALLLVRPAPVSPNALHERSGCQASSHRPLFERAVSCRSAFLSPRLLLTLPSTDASLSRPRPLLQADTRRRRPRSHAPSDQAACAASSEKQRPILCHKRQACS